MSAALRARLLLGVLLLGGCGAPLWKLLPHDLPFQRERPPRLHPPPAERDFSMWWDIFWLTGLRPLAEAISPAEHLRALSGGAPALDVNAFGQVPDSTWFVNRIGRAPMSHEQIRRGPDTGGPQDGPLLVERAVKVGVVPRLLARDGRGVRWVVKLEHPAFPEMGSAAELISTKLLHAAGYLVPENYLVFFDPARLQTSASAAAADVYGKKVGFSEKDLRALLSHLPRRPDGTLRAVFSRFLPGRPVGPSSNFGLRPDDPNDTIPHERRRSRRGLWVFAAWLNHSDMRQQQTLDTFIPVGDGRLGYVRHYLLDFGSTLGSGESIAKLPDSGFEHFLDWPVLLGNLATLGLYYRPWLKVTKSPYRAVGIFEAKQFEPASWRPLFPMPAFERATAQDTYWAAAILARLTPTLIAAAVETGGYTEPGAAEWVLRVLLERREKLLRHAFARVLALDDARAVGHRLELFDLERETGLLRSAGRCYAFAVRWARTGAPDRRLGAGLLERPSLDLQPFVEQVRAAAHGAFEADPFLTVRWERRCGPPRPSLDVHLRAVRGGVLPVGISRDER